MKRLTDLLPFLRWFPLRAPLLKADLVAGVTVALVLVPQSMAYAQLAGMPPYYGLYAAFLPVMIGALWGSSHQLATGPVAMVSLLTGSMLANFAAPGTDQFIALAILLALIVGVMEIALGLLRLGATINFLSHPVIVGFTNAAAIIIALSQLHKLLGIPADRSGSFLADIWGILSRAGDTRWLTLLMGIAAFAIMWLLRKYAPRWPGVLVAVAVTTVASWQIGFENAGGAVVGAIPAGLPKLAMPQLSGETIMMLLSTAFVITLVGFMETISIARAMATKTRQRIDPNQELFGQGLANVVGSVCQSFPVSGSFSRSAVNLSAGAVTGMSSVVTGVIVLVTLLAFTSLLYHLPQSVLAAIIMMAVVNLVNLRAIRHIWKAQRHDGLAAIATFAATLVFAPHLDTGILIGAALAIVLYLYRTMRPRVVVLGRHPDGTLRDATMHDLPTSRHVIAIRFDGSLYFANVPYFEDAVLEEVARHPEARYVLIVCDGINELDASGEEVIRHLVQRLRDSGVTLVFSGLKHQVLQVMERTGLVELVGSQNLSRTEDQALEAIHSAIGAGRLPPEDFLLRPFR
ncbi:MAG: SulP family inorganic anion transporter [Burkholderiales bacterium]